MLVLVVMLLLTECSHSAVILQVCEERHRFETLMDYFKNYDEFHIDFMVSAHVLSVLVLLVLWEGRVVLLLWLLYGDVAQWVEHRSSNPKTLGSIPWWGIVRGVFSIPPSQLVSRLVCALTPIRVYGTSSNLCTR